MLVVEDAARLLEILADGCGRRGTASTGRLGRGGRKLAAVVPYDAIVLDIRLPDIDGFEVCRPVRAADCWSPILMLTARDAVDDRVRALDIGADDYLTKPFEFPELFARVRALVRRGARGARRGSPSAASSSTRPRTLLKERRRRVDLTAKEFALLEYFMRHPGQALRGAA